MNKTYSIHDILFSKINGNGKYVKVLVNGNLEEELFIQPSIKRLGIEEGKYVRIRGSSLFDEKTIYELKEPGNDERLVKKIRRTVKKAYKNSPFSGSEIEIRIQ